MPIDRIRLLPHSPEHLLALIEGGDVYERRFQIKLAEGVRDFLVGPEVSLEFLQRLRSQPEPDPWRDGFAVLHLADNLVIGLCSFVGPPDREGMVEIAYGIAPAFAGRGFASEAARALIARARADGEVRTIRAHTLPEANASTRVLTKSGFTFVGEIIHPEDGPVWRWELCVPNEGATRPARRCD